MKIVENKTELKGFLKEIRKKGKKIGLIPTMGNIHEGHLSLIRACQKLDFYSLVTIFINPTQFDEIKDYNSYPQDKENDENLLENLDTNLLFYPTVENLYSNGVKSKKTIFKYRNILCDNYRIGHFDGVTTVVNSLFQLIEPDHVFFGEKDFQQLKMIQYMLEENKSSTTMHSCPSIRMSNGMSYSSRYKKFSLVEELFFNEVADLLMQSLSELRKKTNIKILKDLECELRKKGINKIDYLEIREDINLLLSKRGHNERLFIAFNINEIRIIDNFILY